MPPPPGVGSEQLANPMFEALVGTVNSTLPDVDIWDPSFDVPWGPGNPVFDPVQKVTVAELVQCVEALQANFKDLLEEQTEKQRITNADYAKTLLGLSQVAMQGAVQFMLGKDQAYWMAVRTQAEAIGAKIQNEKARMEIMLLRAQFAKTKEELAAIDSQFGVSELQRTEVLPAQIDLTHEQRLMVHEQMEAQRAQTVDTRSDGESRLSTVENPDGSTETRLQGLLGVQNFLYRQQIISYRHDGQMKAGKIFSDLWMTMKTVDGLTQPSDYFRPPAPGQSTPLDSVFKNIRNVANGNYTDPWTPTTPP